MVLGRVRSKELYTNPPPLGRFKLDPTAGIIATARPTCLYLLPQILLTPALGLICSATDVTPLEAELKHVPVPRRARPKDFPRMRRHFPQSPALHTGWLFCVVLFPSPQGKYRRLETARCQFFPHPPSPFVQPVGGDRAKQRISYPSGLELHCRSDYTFFGISSTILSRQCSDVSS